MGVGPFDEVSFAGFGLGRKHKGGIPSVFSYQGETKDLRVNRAYEGETKELGEVLAMTERKI
jgi:hypothetical protein